jgi:hypothetical protein
MLVSEFLTEVLSYMDAEGSNRWTPATITAVGGIVSTNEWSDILDQNRFYKFSSIPVVADSQGRIPIASLTIGTGDSTQYFYRLLNLNDGNWQYNETDYNYVPMAAVVGSQSPNMYQYYLAGDFFQVLPIQPGATFNVTVNWTPPTIAQLAGTTSVIPFVSTYEYLLVWVTAATLLMKGAAESQAAADLMSLADGARKNMLGQIARRTTRPTFALYPDSAASWGPF